MKTDFESYPFFQVCSLLQSYPHYFFDFALRNVPFQRENFTLIDQVGLDWTCGLNYDNPSPHYFHSILIFFIIDYIVQSYFVPVLKTLSSQPNPNIVDCIFVFKMLGHYYPQNIWYFEFSENYDFQFYLLTALFHKNLLAQIFLGTLNNDLKESLSKNLRNTCRLLIKMLFYNQLILLL